MAYHSIKWYEDLPGPWDVTVRGFFKIWSKTFDSYELRKTPSNEIMRTIWNELQDRGVFDFLDNNGISIRYNSSSVSICCVNKMHLDQVELIVMVDMPAEVRTLYTLTFTGAKNELTQ